MESLAMSSVVY